MDFQGITFSVTVVGFLILMFGIIFLNAREISWSDTEPRYRRIVLGLITVGLVLMLSGIYAVATYQPELATKLFASLTMFRK